MLSIFSNILGILISADGGISSAVFIRIYKPAADNDIKGINEVFSLIRYVNYLKAIVILIFGLIISIFIPSIITDTTFNKSFLRKSFYIYLLITSSNYFVAFYASYIEVQQKRFVQSLIDAIVYTFIALLEYVCIIYVKKYFVYLIISTSAPIITNILCRFYVFRKFPYLRESRKIKSSLKDLRNTFGLMIHTFADIISKFTDTILISIFAGLTTTGLYANYKSLNQNINLILNQITLSSKDTVRHKYVTNSREENYLTLVRMQFLIIWISGLCVICLSGLSNPFVRLWLGNDYLLPGSVVVITAFTIFQYFQNFYIIDDYYIAGCYEKDKKSPIIEISVNLLISILLGIRFGITGVMLGTVFYYIVQLILRSYQLFKKSLQRSFIPFLVRNVLYSLVIIGLSFVAFIITRNFILPNFLFFVLLGLIFLISINIIFILLTFYTKEFRFYLNILLIKLRRK